MDCRLLCVSRAWRVNAASSCAEPFQVGRNQIAAGQLAAFVTHQTGGVGVGEEEHEPLARQVGGRDAVPHVPHFLRPQQAVVQSDDDLELVRRMRVLQVQDRRRQRPMNAGRTLVRGRAPHAVVDAHRRRDVAAGDTNQAAALRRFDAVHGVGSLADGP